MNKIKAILIFTALSLLFVNNAVYAQMSTTDIDALVEKAMKEFNVAGVAVGIVKDGKVIHEKGYGVRSVDSNLLVNEHTNFQIASNSKAFTTAALAILVDEGKLSWKDKVRAYIPEFKLYNDYVTENFLVEDLLTHRSGLGLGAGDLMIFPGGANFTIKDVLTNFQYFKPVSAFRTQYDYDNQLYIVAGELISRVSGLNWEKFVQARIMEPLQMNNSFTSFAAIKDKSNIATPHYTTTGKMRAISLYPDQMNGAAGGVYSNVDDMSKWMLAQLNKGKYGPNLDKQLFTENSQHEMWAIHTVIQSDFDTRYGGPRYNQHFSGYGLGWHLIDIKGNLSVSHEGVLPGMLSTVTMISDLKLGIVILTNTEPGGEGVYNAVSQTIIDSYLGLDNFGWLAKYSKDYKARQNNDDSVTAKVWETVAAAKNIPVKNEDYIGMYEDKWFGKVEIFLKGGLLWFKSLRSPKINGAMQFYKANTFAIKWEEFRNWNPDAFAIFSLDEEGKAQSIRMKGISPNIDFSYDFQDLGLQRIEK
jgi:CubicO group peptidase (beta-lactamase class C family)